MADLITVCGALMTLFGFVFLLWFIRRLGFLELDAALMGDDFQWPKMQPWPMVEVQNPFKMTVSSSNQSNDSNKLGCIELIVSCTDLCYISCYWKVKRETLEKKVVDSQSENNSGNDSESLAASNLKTVLQNNYKILFDKELTDPSTEKQLLYRIEEIMKKSGDEPDFVCDQTRYDLVITMELTPENRDQMEIPSSIVAMLVGINLRKEGQHFKPCAVQQYIQSLNGQLFKLKKLFLEEADNGESEESSSRNEEQSLCIVCHTLPISRALIPCGHACLCVLCFDKMNACPMCRQLITSSFILREEPNIHEPTERQFSEILKSMNPVEIIKGIYNAT